MVSLGRLNPFKFCKGCLPQILLGPFLNTLSHINVIWTYEKPTSCKGSTLYFVYNLYSIKLTNDSKDFTTRNMLSYRLHLIYLMLEADRINLTTFTLILVMNIF